MRRTLLVMLAVLLSGCVSTATVKLDQEKSSKLRGKSLVLSTSDRPDFAAMTSGKAMFGLFGAFAMISAGNKIIRQNNVEDPAVYIGKEVAKELSQHRKMNLNTPVVSSNEDSIEYLSSALADHDYAIDVRTINWSFVYIPTNWNHYRVIYTAKARLIDLHEQVVIAEAFCTPGQSSASPTYEQLVSNNAAKLKSKLQEAAVDCAIDLSDKLL